MLINTNFTNIFFQNVADIDRSISTVTETLRQRNLTLQPFLVVTGELTNSEQYFVIVNDIKYETKNFLDALDLIFKLFYVANCEYPYDSSTVWLFIQKSVFLIDEKSDRPNVSINILIGKVEHAFQNETI